MPARVIWGALDAMVPLAHADAYAKGLPGSVGAPLVIAGAGHAVQLESPDAVAAAVMSAVGAA